MVDGILARAADRPQGGLGRFGEDCYPLAMEQKPSSDPAEEFARLAAGVSAHAQRLSRRGRRRVEAPPTATPPVRREPAATPPPARTAAVMPPEPQPRAPARTPSVEATVTLTPARRAAALAQAAAEAEAARNRDKARACADLPSLRAAVAACTSCGLCQTRKQTVFMDGTGRVPVMFVGEAPGAHEDEQGLPFVGRAGALLTDIITKGMGLAREDVVIANVLKCRPPDNRDPSDVEKLLCTPWLDRQIELIDPKVLIPLGGHAAKHLLGSTSSLGALRARVHERGGRKLVPTFHPAYLLRSPGEKAECWKDIQLAMAELGLTRPAPGRPR